MDIECIAQAIFLKKKTLNSYAHSHKIEKPYNIEIKGVNSSAFYMYYFYIVMHFISKSPLKR